MLGAIGCIIAIVFMVYSIFKGLHPLIAALVATMAAILFNSVPIWSTLIDGFGTGMTGFVKSYVIMFFLGAVFGEFMSRSGFARSIAYKLVDLFGPKRGLLVVVVATWVLNYSGVSVFVIIFAIYPIALYVFQQSDIPKRIIPGVVNLGAGTLTMTMLPGTPALTNVIPANYLGTTIYAAPILGSILAVVAAVLGLIYLNWQVKVWKAKGEHFAPGPNDIIEPMTEESKKNLPNFFVAFVPVLIIFFGNLIGTRMGLNATFAVCISIFLGSVYTILVNWGRISNSAKLEGLNKGATSSVFAIMNTAAIVGFAGAVRTLPSFTSFTDLATSLNFSPLLSAVLAMDIICAITASSSGGITIFMELLGPKFLAMGVNPQLLHRLTSVAAGTLDSLPHAGPNATFMSVCGLTYKEGYFPVFVITCIIPLICQFLGLALAALGIC
jgi:H+/gluconate symporter-like permease